ENGKNFKVKVELPGVEESDLEIAITNGGLVIQGEKSEERTEENEKTLHRECHYGSFSRSLKMKSVRSNTEKKAA
ncbi:MAG: Hsp20/alpha crystallin family protein, partial [Alphaproteobacteria bacterium]